MLVPSAAVRAGMGAEMSDEARGLRPPKRVIVVVVLAYISGIFDIIAGILLILLRYDDAVRASGGAFPITLLGTGMILIGLLTVAMASGLTRGRNIARIFVTALVVAVDDRGHHRRHRRAGRRRRMVVVRHRRGRDRAHHPRAVGRAVGRVLPSRPDASCCLIAAASAGAGTNVMRATARRCTKRTTSMPAIATNDEPITSSAVVNDGSVNCRKSEMNGIA